MSSDDFNPSPNAMPSVDNDTGNDPDLSCLNINTSKDIEDWDKDDIIGLEFDTVEDAENFYTTYSKCMGFGARKDDLRRSKDGRVTLRRMVCYKEGYRQKQHIERENRQREPKAITRVGCGAAFKVNFCSKVNKYVVREFIAEHNHPLVSMEKAQFLRAQRKVKEPNKAQIKSLKGAGISTSHVMDVMVNQVGGYSYVGYTAKDLYNFVDADRRSSICDGDVESALAYLRAKAESDPEFYCKFTVEEESGKLGHLFWADGNSCRDYACFGDVLVFDATYKTNAYNMPLVVLVGANHHHSTTVFGCALLNAESFFSYKWLLDVFLDGMKGMKPKLILTDGAKSMRKAIKTVMPEVHHRLCSWHLSRNATSNVPGEEFKNVFDRCANKIKQVEAFEELWRNTVEKLNLHDNEWVSKMYKIRDRWAHAFFVGKFTCGMKSTQRCEAMHSVLKRFLTSRSKLFEFVEQFHRGLRRLRYEEIHNDHVSNDSTPVCDGHLVSLEKHAAEIYTRDMFFKIRKQIRKEALFYSTSTVTECDRVSYVLSQYSEPKWSWRVSYYPAAEEIKCSCQLFESKGIPCCHCFFVMKVNNITLIPHGLVLKRWCKAAKEGVNVQLDKPEVNIVIRSGTLGGLCGRLCHFASKTSEGYHITKNDLERLISLNEEIWEKKKEAGKDDDNAQSTERTRTSGVVVKDPHVVKTKGCSNPISSTKKVRHCKHCKNAGHDYRTCPQRPYEINVGGRSSGSNPNDGAGEGACMAMSSSAGVCDSMSELLFRMDEKARIAREGTDGAFVNQS